MLNLNKQHKYKTLYNMLHHITSAPTDRILDFAHGQYSGWTCAKCPTEWSNTELEPLDNFVKQLVKIRRKEIFWLEMVVSRKCPYCCN